MTDTLLRERIAMEVHRQGWDADLADRMLAWISGNKKSPKKTATAKTKKRKYTKKAKFWNKKRK